MGVNYTHLSTQDSGDLAGAASWTSAGITVPDNCMLVVIASIMSNGSSANPATGFGCAKNGGAALTPIQSSGSTTAWTIGVKAWRANVTTGGSWQLDMSTDVGAGAYRVRIYVLAVTGHRASAPIGANVADTWATNGADTTTLNSTPDTTSLVIAAAAYDPPSGVTGIIEGSLWTELVDSTTAVSDGLFVQARTGLTSTAVPVADGASGTGAMNQISVAIAFEIQADLGRYVTDPLLNATAVSLPSYSSKWSDPNAHFTMVAGNGGVECSRQAVDIAWWNAGTFDDAQWAEIELAYPGPGNDYIGPAVRCKDAGGTNGYWWYATLGSGASWFWGYIVNSSYTQVDSGATTGWAAGDKMRMEVKGTTVRLFRNGVQVGSDYTGRTESSSGSPGICGYHNALGTGTNGKNWVGSDLQKLLAWGYMPSVQHILHNPR